ncbi:MAG: hypothetical protein ACRD47_02915 [Nitrososphaeraceae archaeon]|jgi:hypothetical protein
MLITIGSSMNAKYFAIVAAITVMLVGATALSTTDNAFAGKKKYEKSQAASQVNECGNGELPLNVFCQNLLSQIQGDGNAVNVIGVQ